MSRSVASSIVPILLAGLVSSSPASAQDSNARPDAAPALQDIRLDPPVLRLSPILSSSRMQFEEKDGVLLLTDPPTTWTGPEPPHKVLWSGSLSSEPNKFTLATSKFEEDLKDSAGRVVWSQRFEEPGLKLDFSQENLVILRDSQGEELGSAPYDASAPSVLSSGPPYKSGYAINSISVESDPQKQQTQVYSGDMLIWSGKLANNGLRFGTASDSPIYGIPGPRCPVGTVLTFEVSQETGSADVIDENSRLLETVPTDTLHLAVHCNDESFRDDRRNWFLFSQHTDQTSFDLNALGEISVKSYTAKGDLTESRTIKAVKEDRQITAADPLIYYMTFIVYFDGAGKQHGSGSVGRRPLKHS